MSDNACPICFEEDGDIRTLPCMHTFCRECIEKVKKGRNVKCPNCRKDHHIEQVSRLQKPICVICSQLCSNPKKFSSCSHLFCDECIPKRPNNGGSCPKCSHKVKEVRTNSSNQDRRTNSSHPLASMLFEHHRSDIHSSGMETMIAQRQMIQGIRSNLFCPLASMLAEHNGFDIHSRRMETLIAHRQMTHRFQSFHLESSSFSFPSMSSVSVGRGRNVSLFGFLEEDDLTLFPQRNEMDDLLRFFMR